MAHHVRTRKIAQFSKKDGHILKGKYIYRVECKHRACRSTPIGEATSAAQADYLKSEHHWGVSFLHSVNHPNDKAHERVIRNKENKAVTRGH